MNKQNQKLSENRTYIYTDQCVTCGKTEAYKDIVNRLKLKNKDVFVKQTPLFVGWQNEATELGLELPSVYDCDTGNKATVKELDAKSEEELDKWLGV